MRECGLRDKAGKIKFWRVSWWWSLAAAVIGGAGQALLDWGSGGRRRRRLQRGNVIDDVVADGVTRWSFTVLLCSSSIVSTI